MVPAYFWAGGTAGASATLALAARLAGNPRLARSALVAAAAGVAVTPPLLVADLGRPGRFLNMLRVAKVTSPMSVGTWVLTLFCPAVTVAVAAELSGRLRRLGRAAEVVAASLGPVMATYTAVLVADTAIPAWHRARRELPFLFAGGAAAGAGAAAVLLTPAASAGPARNLAAAGAALELGAQKAMEHQLGPLGEPYRSGSAAVPARAAARLTATGAVLVSLGTGSRVRARGGAALVLAGAALTRWSVFRAGFDSASDPTYTITSQRGA
jgi:hypothetical protein